MKVRGAFLGLAVLLVGTPAVYLVATRLPYFQFRQQPLTVAEARDLAQAVTVRLIGESGLGSGVLIAFDGSNYKVLTNRHVVEMLGDKFAVMTGDGQTHPGQKVTEARLDGLDLALVSFAAPKKYIVAPLVARKLKPHDKLYAAGFPNYRTVSPDRMEDTRTWGTKAFHFTQGNFAMQLEDKFLQGGYALGYTNEVEQGMSGGPVIDAYGKVVAVNGRLKYPIQGIDAFTFTDGSKPSKAEYEMMESLSWGVPIPDFLIPRGIEQ
ncbi:MAG: serine protease [Pseudanabaenaceae cyanobacterium SKYGB_i_bin29]|nr:serine protease [Pseudanabaenaceae cyanobacterium SKYG29]MDW8421044.1 serine protease [Pseudanabaenaceae cyanobacterium SKYGB_i_bin29]